MPDETPRKPRMGVFQVRVRFYSLRDEAKERELEVTVDTGATLSVIPREIAQVLDAVPEGQRWFLLANGERISRHIGYAGVEYEDRRAPTTVVLGERQDAPVLGAVALEALGYEADPISKTLRPVTHYLLYEAGPERASARSY